MQKNKPNNIKNNILSLKAIEALLKELEASIKPSIASQSVVNDSKGSQKIITRFRTAFSPFMGLITLLFAYGHKIPGVTRILLSLRRKYGTSTIWIALILFRKLFIVINAIIGVLAVFKITGFSSDNLIAGFYGLGATYLEMLGSFIKRLFNWIYDIFDNRIVPKPPVDSSWKWPIDRLNGNRVVDYATKSDYERAMRPDPLEGLTNLLSRSDYINSVPKPSISWYDILWYGGAALMSLGVLYLGVSIYQDPTIITKIFYNPAPAGVNPVNPPANP